MYIKLTYCLRGFIFIYNILPSRWVRQKLQPLEIAAYAYAGGNNEIGVKLEAMEGSQAVRKRTNSRRKLLYRLLGGRLVLGPIPL